MNKFCLSLLVIFTGALVAYAADNNLKAFPPAEEGMTRFVLKLPEHEDESALRLELLIGQTHQLDEVNRYFLGGKIEEVNIEGWGFTRYVVNKVGPLAGTLIGVDPDAPKVDRFITLGGEPYLIRYNSKLPVVVYVPQGTEVRYRIWRADAEIGKMEQG